MANYNLLSFTYSADLNTGNTNHYTRQVVFDPDGLHYWLTARWFSDQNIVYYWKRRISDDVVVAGPFETTQGGSGLIGEGGFFVDDTYVYVACRTQGTYQYSAIKTFLKSDFSYQSTYSGVGWDALAKPAFVNLGMGWYQNGIFAYPSAGEIGNGGFDRTSIVLYYKASNSFVEICKGQFTTGYIGCVHDGTYVYAHYYGNDGNIMVYDMNGNSQGTINTGYARTVGMGVYGGNQIFAHVLYNDGTNKNDIVSFDKLNNWAAGPKVTNIGLASTYVLGISGTRLFRPTNNSYVYKKYTLSTSLIPPRYAFPPSNPTYLNT